MCNMAPVESHSGGAEAGREGSVDKCPSTVMPSQVVVEMSGLIISRTLEYARPLTTSDINYYNHHLPRAY